jgi:large subunit GTPase 1
MSSDELTALEGEAFLNWRRGLARIEEGQGLIMTPYERNLDFWRQLWRCVERSDLLVQILDARDPEFYRCHDLERYVGEWESKKTLLLINKADFLTPELRSRWKQSFAAAGVDHLFFSALRELHRQQRLPSAASSEGASEGSVLPPHGSLVGDAEDNEVLDCSRLLEEISSRLPMVEESDGDEAGDSGRGGVVGFVGYPNVGKSSVINALWGAKKVSMSRTPGKTKHLQTLELPDAGITLCDCPGLVFPSVVATKAHLVINGTVPLTELREPMAPARLVVEKVGVSHLIEKYGLSPGSLQEAAQRLGDENAVCDQTRSFLAALSMVRQHFLRFGVPDEGWSARKILRDYVTGELLYCEEPPGFLPPHRPVVTVSGEDATAKTEPVLPQPTGKSAVAAEPSDSDFSDLEDFLNEARGSQGQQATKRKTRQQNKRS